MERLCIDCKHLKHATVYPRTRGARQRYWCGLTEKPDGTGLGIYINMTEPHPKCPITEVRKER